MDHEGQSARTMKERLKYQSFSSIFDPSNGFITTSVRPNRRNGAPVTIHFDRPSDAQPHNASGKSRTCPMPSATFPGQSGKATESEKTDTGDSSSNMSDESGGKGSQIRPRRVTLTEVPDTPITDRELIAVIKLLFYCVLADTRHRGYDVIMVPPIDIAIRGPDGDNTADSSPDPWASQGGLSGVAEKYISGSLLPLLPGDKDGQEMSGPHSQDKPPELLTPSMISETLACCADAVDSSIFHQDYPSYCLRKLNSFSNRYMQGTFLLGPDNDHTDPPVMSSDRCKRAAAHVRGGRCPEPAEAANQNRRVVAAIVTNGMDYYSSLKPTVERLRRTMVRKRPDAGGADDSNAVSEATTTTLPFVDDRMKLLARSVATGGSPTSSSGGAGRKRARVADGIELPIRDSLDAYVNISLLITDLKHRGRSLSKRLMVLEILRWLLRGRCHFSLSLSLERRRWSAMQKAWLPIGSPNSGRRAEADSSQEPSRREMSAKVPLGRNKSLSADSASGDNDTEDDTVICAPNEAALRLYRSFSFIDVFPRYHREGEAWTPYYTSREQALGRVMVIPSEMAADTARRSPSSSSRSAEDPPGGVVLWIALVQATYKLVDTKEDQERLALPLPPKEKLLHFVCPNHPF